jgi:hypothetical protein
MSRSAAESLILLHHLISIYVHCYHFPGHCHYLLVTPPIFLSTCLEQVQRAQSTPYVTSGSRQPGNQLHHFL